MKLLTETIRKQLLRNGVIRLALEGKGEAKADFVPVVKLFTPDANCTWLLSEIDPEDQDIPFGLCDLGMGYPELGNVRNSELKSVRGRLGLLVERDLHFRPLHTLSIYARAAWKNAAITECKDALRMAAEALPVERERTRNLCREREHQGMRSGAIVCAGHSVRMSPVRRTKVFISSVYREPLVSGSDKHLAIRRRAYDIANDAGIDAWIAEYSAKGLENAHWTEIADTCIENLLQSDLVIVLLFRRAGGAVRLDHEYGFATASIFEIELFYASLRLKPVYFFEVRSYEPEPELQNLIGLLKLAQSGNWFTGSESDVERQLRDLFAHLPAWSGEGWTLPDFCDAASSFKSVHNVDAEIRSENLSLIDRLAPVDTGDFSPGRVDHLLTLADEAQSRTAQFSRLWMAMRELSKRSADGRDAQVMAQWLTISRRLPSIAAWLGLHGPLNVGVIAAYQTQNVLRRLGSLSDSDFPYGGFASESYSMGLNHRRPDWQRLRFRAAERLATQQVSHRPGEPSGALLIRGSARLRLARLGRPWLVWPGLSDFGRACRIRERAGAGSSAMGEALVSRGLAESALARITHVRRQASLDIVRQGIQLLDSDVSADQAGFVVSAKRKFADALRDAGQRDEAENQKRQAADLARKHGLLDQLRRLA